MLGCRNLRQRSGGCNSARDIELYAATQWQQREHRIAAKTTSVSRGFQTDWDVSIWEKLVTYFSVTEVQLAVAVLEAAWASYWEGDAVQM